MERQVLVPLDGSAVAEAVLPHAERYARLTGSSLTLLHVITDIERSQTDFWVATAPADLRRQWEQSALAGVHTYLTALARRLQLAGLSVQTEVPMADDVAAAIVARAQQDPDVALVAMSTHGRGGLGRWVLGSVAAQVLRAVPKPMLMVRARAGAAFYEAMQPYRTILIPLNGSSPAEQALDLVRATPAMGDARLVLVGLMEARDDRDWAEAGAESSVVDLSGDYEAGSLPDYLRHAARRLEADGFVVQARLAAGANDEAILRASAEAHADLIVAVADGRSGLSRLFRGSEIEDLVRHSDMPVMIVPADHTMSGALVENPRRHTKEHE
jgi:nucleotide-binding universal stress UspA family protein